MLSHLPRLLLLGLVVILIWALILGWWKTTDHQPTFSEAALYLLALPFALIMGYWLLGRFVQFVRTSPAPADVTQTTTPVDSAAPNSPQPPALRVMGSALVTAAGDQALDVIGAIQAGKRPTLDDTLMDDDGFPVFAARHAALAIGGEQALSERLDFPAADRSPETLRSLYLTLQAWESITPTVTAIFATPAPDTTATPPRLQVHWLVPYGWSEAVVTRGPEWLQTQFAESLPGVDIDVTAHRTSSDADGLALINTVAEQQATTGHDTLQLMIAGVSYIGEQSIARMQAANALFNANNQDGQIPGEAAVALLFGSPDRADTDAEGALLVQNVRRHRVSDNPDRASNVAMDQLLLDLIGEDAKIDLIHAVVSDTDHRADRQQELLVRVNQRLELLDPVKDCITLGTACGAVSPVAGLLALACAAEVAAEQQRAVICISHSHPTLRAGVLVRTTAQDPSGTDGNA